MTRRALPDTANVAHASDGAKLNAPAAERNLAPLCDLLSQFAPKTGAALEIASGTGQHVVAFAKRLPGLDWQPSEPDAARRASIDAYAAESQLDNLAPAFELDAAAPGWGARHAGQALIVVINLLHLISMTETETLIGEAARALTPSGRFVIYGPFQRGGELTSDGDARFHASLIAQDPEIGYKDDFDILDLALAAGLTVVDVIEMPANNLALVLEKPAI
ncbi:DUF938 domain-containing protein [Sedimentitalea arenosa]|jgi:SAM-dependent methyltransferase|uniref:DUF938 domain-containing protein n=1 Tax=Sedimentitalea arenosa TaxID=2798803 RepID=A0A8J7IVQ2_9RHOB|nr:DUF938 domain-containing protein [Arenibacterium arenosum]MBJ6372267.1 DUF938 domain-containing protein [Arenibacterium arenosum]